MYARKFPLLGSFFLAETKLFYYLYRPNMRKKKRSNKPKSRVLPGFAKFVTYGYTGKKVTQSINSKK
jgi:hypothetical protein